MKHARSAALISPWMKCLQRPKHQRNVYSNGPNGARNGNLSVFSLHTSGQLKQDTHPRKTSMKTRTSKHSCCLLVAGQTPEVEAPSVTEKERRRGAEICQEHLVPKYPWKIYRDFRTISCYFFPHRSYKTMQLIYRFLVMTSRWQYSRKCKCKIDVGKDYAPKKPLQVVFKHTPYSWKTYEEMQLLS